MCSQELSHSALCPETGPNRCSINSEGRAMDTEGQAMDTEGQVMDTGSV